MSWFKRTPKPKLGDFCVTVEPIEGNMWKSTLSKFETDSYGTHFWKSWHRKNTYLAISRQTAIDLACEAKQRSIRVEQCKAQREVVDCP